MTEQQFREIQLTGKQLVFAFMASVVVAITIFLLGISVGRGVRTSGASTADATSDAATITREPEPPAVMPPATKTAPQDLSYHDQLQGQTPPKSQAVSAPGHTTDSPKPDEAPSAVDEPASGQGSAPKVVTPPPTPAPVKSATPAPAVATPTPSTSPAAKSTPAPSPASAGGAPAPAPKGSWMLQAGAFRSRDNADRLVTRLKAKGYAAATSRSGSLVVVKVGPFADRADADRAAQRLQSEEGLKPSVQH